MMEVETLEMFLRLVVALVLGALIGLNRRIYGKPAGLRTMALVSLGSATFTLIGVNAMIQLASAEHAAGFDAMVRLDTSRVIAGIVGGIGFLGAGVILRRRTGGIEGITTASVIWVVAAIGLATGAGLYLIATVTTVVVMLVLLLLRHD